MTSVFGAMGTIYMPQRLYHQLDRSFSSAILVQGMQIGDVKLLTMAHDGMQACCSATCATKTIMENLQQSIHYQRPRLELLLSNASNQRAGRMRDQGLPTHSHHHDRGSISDSLWGTKRDLKLMRSSRPIGYSK
jgi:hypothetical protein